MTRQSGRVLRLGGMVATESPWDLLRVLLRLQIPDLPSRSFLAAKAVRGISRAAGLVSSPLLRAVNIPRQWQGEISSGSSHKRNMSFKLAERCLRNRPAIKYKNKFHVDQGRLIKLQKEHFCSSVHCKGPEVMIKPVAVSAPGTQMVVWKHTSSLMDTRTSWRIGWL